MAQAVGILPRRVPRPSEAIRNIRDLHRLLRAHDRAGRNAGRDRNPCDHGHHDHEPPHDKPHFGDVMMPTLG